MDPTANVPPSIATSSASISTLAFASILVLNMFVVALEVNVTAVASISTAVLLAFKTPSLISIDAASMFTLDVMFSSPAAITVLVESIVVNALSISTFALASTIVLNLFVAALDENKVVPVLIITSSAPILKSAASDVMFTLAVNTALASMFVSVPVIAKFVDVMSVSALSISTLALISTIVLNLFVPALDSKVSAVVLIVTAFTVLFVVTCKPAVMYASDCKCNTAFAVLF